MAYNNYEKYLISKRNTSKYINLHYPVEWHPTQKKWNTLENGNIFYEPQYYLLFIRRSIVLGSEEFWILALRSFHSKMHHCFHVPMRCGSLLLHYLFRVSYMAVNVGVVSDVHHQQAREESNCGASLIFRFNNIHRIVYNYFVRTRYGRNAMVYGVKQILIAI